MGKIRKLAVGMCCSLLISVVGCEMALGQTGKNAGGSTSTVMKSADAELKNADVQNAAFAASRPEIARALYEAAIPYIGSAPDVGSLLNALRENGIMPEDESSMELLTAEPPYGLVIHFAEESKDEEELCRKMYDTGLLLWALVENLENVEWTYPSTTDEIGQFPVVSHARL